MKTVLSKFRRIGIIAGKPSLETAKTIFVLQHVTDPMYGGKKSKINLFTPKEIESSSFQKQLENRELLTLNIPKNKTGRNINSMTELMERMGEKEEKLTTILLIDMNQPTAPDTWEHLFGLTSGNALVDFKANGDDQIKYQERLTDILLPRLRSIIDAVEEFEANFQEKGIWAEKDLLAFTLGKSETDNCLIRTISKADITFHRREEKSGNFISFSPKAEKYMNAILDALNKEELERNPNATRKFWHKHYGVIHTDLGKISRIKFTEISDLIENTLRLFKTETTNGNAMASEAKHFVAPHDSAMAHAPVAPLHQEERVLEGAPQVA